MGPYGCKASFPCTKIGNNKNVMVFSSFYICLKVYIDFFFRGKAIFWLHMGKILLICIVFEKKLNQYIRYDFTLGDSFVDYFI